jgi:hypothetical protein
MKYKFSAKDIEILSKIEFSFDVTKDLTEDEKMLILDELMDRWGFESKESEAFGDVYYHMCKQTDKKL